MKPVNKMIVSCGELDRPTILQLPLIQGSTRSMCSSSRSGKTCRETHSVNRVSLWCMLFITGCSSCQWFFLLLLISFLLACVESSYSHRPGFISASYRPSHGNLFYLHDQQALLFAREDCVLYSKRCGVYLLQCVRDKLFCVQLVGWNSTHEVFHTIKFHFTNTSMELVDVLKDISLVTDFQCVPRINAKAYGQRLASVTM